MKPGNRSCTFDSGANSRSAKALKYEVEVCFEMSLLPWRAQKTFLCQKIHAAFLSIPEKSTEKRERM